MISIREFIDRFRINYFAFHVRCVTVIHIPNWWASFTRKLAHPHDIQLQSRTPTCFTISRSPVHRAHCLRLISLITHLHEFRSLVYVCVYQVDDRLDLFVDGWMTTWCLLIAVVLMIHLLNEQHCQSFTNQFVYSLISVNKQESYLYPDLSILHYLVEQIDLFI